MNNTSTYYVLSRKSPPNVAREYVAFTEWNGAFTLLNDTVKEIKDAAKFLSVGAILERAQVRGRKHPCGTSLTDFQIVKVEETTIIPASLAKITVIPGAEKQQGDVFAIRCNGMHFLSTDASASWTLLPSQARTFTSEAFALQFAVSGSLPNQGGIDSLQFVALRKVSEKPVVTQKLMVL